MLGYKTLLQLPLQNADLGWQNLSKSKEPFDYLFFISLNASDCIVNLLNFWCKIFNMTSGNCNLVESVSSSLLWPFNWFSKSVKYLYNSVHYPYNFLPSSICFLNSLMHTSSSFRSFLTFMRTVTKSDASCLGCACAEATLDKVVNSLSKHFTNSLAFDYKFG